MQSCDASHKSDGDRSRVWACSDGQWVAQQGSQVVEYIGSNKIMSPLPDGVELLVHLLVLYRCILLFLTPLVLAIFLAAASLVVASLASPTLIVLL